METIGEKIKDGSSGVALTISEVIWQGTASVIFAEEYRLPVILAVDQKGKKKIAVYIEGDEFGPYWINAKAFRTREWYNEDDSDLSPEIRDQIESILQEPVRPYSSLWIYGTEITNKVNQGIFKVGISTETH